jgi:hypothetical protein
MLPGRGLLNGEKTVKNSHKRWSKPELTVLVRNKPEEAMLTVCKLFIGAGPASSERCDWGDS